MRDIDFLIIHHLGAVPAGFPVEDPVETVRSWHKGRGWSDIGYHKLISPSGAVHQGRADAVVGAHAFGANGPSLGILVVGDFRTKAPGAAQRKALVNVLATLCKRHGVPVSHIIGHRDVPRLFPGGAASDCPGDALYGQLSAIRKEVEAYL